MIRCPNCDGKKVNKLRKLSSNFVYRCSSCILGFQYPLPKKDQIKNYYEQSIYPEVWGKASGSFGQMKRITYHWIFDHLEKGKGRKLLDVGTGYGFCLLEASRRGYQPIGIEPSSQLSTISQRRTGVKIINDFFENVHLDKRSFFIVSLFDTIEHILNPWQMLKKAVSLITPGGYLVITTPDITSFSAKLMDQLWFHFKDEHYYYFSPDILTKLLGKEGFTVTKCIPQKRPLTLAYIENHLRIYPLPLLSAILKRIISWLPAALKNQVFTVYDGNLLMIAQKKITAPLRSRQPR